MVLETLLQYELTIPVISTCTHYINVIKYDTEFAICIQRGGQVGCRKMTASCMAGRDGEMAMRFAQ